MAAAEAVPAGPARQEPRHGLRIAVIWVVLSVAADLVIWFVWGPHMPPGDMSSSAAAQQFDFNVLAVIGAPVLIGVWVYFGYALIMWRQKEGDDEDGPGYLPGAVRVQATWIVVTSAIVLGLAGFGTYELIAPAGAGSGQGPQPAFNNGVLAAASDTSWSPNTNNILQVQVIAQQWLFTYRYPQFGGFETTDLVLPVGQQVRFNVTSLDVIHSFWAYQLGVKADANPFVNNIAYTTPKQEGGFTVRCAELCGLWHGAMYNYGKVESVSDFLTWAHSTETQLASLTRTLPPYALIYTPNEISGLAKFYYQAGLPGAGAQYYGPQYPAEP